MLASPKRNELRRPPFRLEQDILGDSGLCLSPALALASDKLAHAQKL